jgi:hypothetical protein
MTMGGDAEAKTVKAWDAQAQSLPAADCVSYRDAACGFEQFHDKRARAGKGTGRRSSRNGDIEIVAPARSYR